MTTEDDLRIIAEQEQMLQFPSFHADDAWRLGVRLRELAQTAAKPVAATIWMAGQTLFYAVTTGASAYGVPPSSEEWLRRKRNTVVRFGKSSLRVGRELERDGTTLEVRQGLMLADYAAHGGGFPLTLRGSGCVGAVVVSGLTQAEDHTLVVKAIAATLGLNVPRLGDDSGKR